MIRQLEDELREYDQLKSGELTPTAYRAAGRNRSLHRQDSDREGRFTDGIGASTGCE
jgi:hypothetical protein